MSKRAERARHDDESCVVSQKRRECTDYADRPVIVGVDESDDLLGRRNILRDARGGVGDDDVDAAMARADRIRQRLHAVDIGYIEKMELWPETFILKDFTGGSATVFIASGEIDAATIAKRAAQPPDECESETLPSLSIVDETPAPE